MLSQRKGDIFCFVAEREGNKRLLVLHKTDSGIKNATQAGESSDAFMSAAAVHSGRQRRPQAIFRLSCATFLG